MEHLPAKCQVGVVPATEQEEFPRQCRVGGEVCADPGGGYLEQVRQRWNGKAASSNEPRSAAASLRRYAVEATGGFSTSLIAMKLGTVAGRPK